MPEEVYLFVLLNQLDMDKHKNGQMLDRDITSNYAINATNISSMYSKNYCYLLDISVYDEHKLHGSSLLIEAFFDQLIEFKKRNIPVVEICAEA